MQTVFSSVYRAIHSASISRCKHWSFSFPSTNGNRGEVRVSEFESAWFRLRYISRPTAHFSNSTTVNVQQRAERVNTQFGRLEAAALVPDHSLGLFLCKRHVDDGATFLVVKNCRWVPCAVPEMLPIDEGNVAQTPLWRGITKTDLRTPFIIR